MLLGVKQPLGRKRIKHSRQLEDTVRLYAGLRQLAGAALLAIDEDDDVLDHQARRTQLFGRFDRAAAAGDQVLDHHHAFARLPCPFDQLAETMALGLFARVDSKIDPTLRGK